MSRHEERYRIAAGDRIRSKFGTTAGMEGVVIKVHRDPPSITAGFDPENPKLIGFMVGSSGKVDFRLAIGEFEVINKTKYSIPTGSA